MQEIDPIATATTSLLAAVAETLHGGDPNRLRGPYAAVMRAKGQGKAAAAVDKLPRLPWVKPKR